MEHNLVERMVASMVALMALQWAENWDVKLDYLTAVQMDVTWVECWADSMVL